MMFMTGASFDDYLTARLCAPVYVFLLCFVCQEVGVRLLNMVADVSKEVNEVFGYADDASSGGEQLG